MSFKSYLLQSLHRETTIVKGTIQRRILIATLLIIAAAISSPFIARAEESGSGHYLPGATASFLDMLPDRGTSTFAYLNAFTFYDGSAGAVTGHDGPTGPLSIGSLATVMRSNAEEMETKPSLPPAPRRSIQRTKGR